MKAFKLILIFFSCLASLNSNAQNVSQRNDAAPDTSAILKINPVGKDTSYKKVRFGGLYKFSISHVNTIKLNGYVKSEPYNFEPVAPGIFANATIPDLTKDVDAAAEKEFFSPDLKLHQYALIMPDGTKKILSEKNSQTNADKIEALKQQLASRNKELIASFEKSYLEFVANYQILQRCTSAEDTLYHMLPDVIIRDVKGLKLNTKAYMTSVYEVLDDAELETALTKTIKKFNDSFITLKGAYEALNGTIVSDATDITGGLKNSSGSVTINISKATSTIKYDPKFLDEYTNATKVYNGLNTGDGQSKLFNKAFKGITLYRTIQRESFVAYTDAEQLTDDEKQSTPSLKNNKGIVVKEFSPVTIKAFGGLKVNFTTGYLLTFRGDDNYSYYNDLSTGKIAGIAKQKSNVLTNSIGALAHVYFRTSSGAAPAVSGGFSLTNNGNIGFYLGGSGLFLEKNRLALSAGLSFIKVNVLNQGNLTPVKEDAGKYTFNSTETAIHYDALYKPGFFVGITYNIFTKSDPTK